jgi:cyanate permease
MTINLKVDLPTIFGVMTGLPLLAYTSFNMYGITLSAKATHALALVAGLGAIGLGIWSKSVNTHSTPLQVAASGAEVTNQPNAPALVKQADAQVAAKK